MSNNIKYNIFFFHRYILKVGSSQTSGLHKIITVLNNHLYYKKRQDNQWELSMIKKIVDKTMLNSKNQKKLKYLYTKKKEKH